jgi:hypothetical protein
MFVRIFGVPPVPDVARPSGVARSICFLEWGLP